MISTLRLDASNLQISDGSPDTLFNGVMRNGSILLFTGINLQLVNGLSNLIIGCNENSHPFFDLIRVPTRTGFHNLVVGPGQEYSSYGGSVAGKHNTISAESASVLCS